MARVKKRISYVLPLASNATGHRLGVNGLAVDPDSSILYSGGRDGVICAWNLNLDLSGRDPDDLGPSTVASDSKRANLPPTTCRQQVQAHSHWINDIVLAQDNQALVSASSDLTVKLWRPAAQDIQPPQTIGLHTDYVKCLASPGPHASWVASGGLDRKVCLWDLNASGQKLEIGVGEEEKTAKGSVYALAVSDTILACGGPESIVRVWDPRSGKRITKFVGHTDNIRDVLITRDGDTIMTASSDQTVKIWSMTAGRCMYTLTMHNDSVWSLYSDHPQLSVFYSSDRSGVVAKTDVRNCLEMDEGLSIALCQEHEGVNKVVAAGDYVWTATSNSGINRWNDIDTQAGIRLPESYKLHRPSLPSTRSRHSLPPDSSPPARPHGAPDKQTIVPPKSILRLSNTAPFPFFQTKETETADPTHTDPGVVTTVRSLPDFSIEGQNGLIKHVLLNDRRRVLTLDTAGEVMLWDLVKCVPIKSFGKRHLDDVAPEVNTQETVAHWCAVNTRTGSLTCVLEENYCFDAEMYADELQLEEKIEFRDDQRINLGKWILRYLFANLIDEEIKRDEEYRQKLIQDFKGLQRDNAPLSIDIPHRPLNGWKDLASGPASSSTIRAANGAYLPPATPGLGINLATPCLPTSSHGQGEHQNFTIPPTLEEGSNLEKTNTQHSQSRSSTDRSNDYFSSSPAGQAATSTTNGNGKGAGTNEGKQDEAVPQSPVVTDKAGKEGKALFGKKFRMNMSFGMKGLNRSASSSEADKPVVTEEAKVEDSGSDKSKADERVVEDNFWGSIQKIRHGYEDQLNEGATTLNTGITPSLPNETPVLKPPLNTTILIQEDKADSGGVADLFEGKVGDLGAQADLIEKVAPMWLGDVLLRNTIPPKDIVKVSFVLEPWQNSLPSIASDGNNRLNANRMLRARKILAYVAERIEPASDPHHHQHQPNGAHSDPLKPEEYLELYCQGQLIPPTMTLATIRAHVWRGGGDVLMYYKANGRKTIRHVSSSPSPPPPPPPPVETAGMSPATTTNGGQGSPSVLPPLPQSPMTAGEPGAAGARAEWAGLR